MRMRMINGNKHSELMLICNLTVCVHLQVYTRDNMIFAQENNTQRRQSKQLNLIKTSIAQQHRHTHCSWWVNERRVLTENAKIIATVSLFRTLENCRLLSSNRIFDY
jgi:hypothetical protein